MAENAIEKVELKQVIVASEHPRGHKKLIELIAERGIPVEEEDDIFNLIWRLMNIKKAKEPKKDKSTLLITDHNFLGPYFHQLSSLIRDAGFAYLPLGSDYVCKPPYDELGDVFGNLRCHYSNLE
jgi:hypothetical protein